MNVETPTAKNPKPATPMASSTSLATPSAPLPAISDRDHWTQETSATGS